MKSKEINLTNLPANTLDIVKIIAKTSSRDIFKDIRGGYLDEFALFFAIFRNIPHYVHEYDIDCRKANKWFLENYRNDIQSFYYSKLYYSYRSATEYDDLYCVLSNGILAYFETGNSMVRLLFIEEAFSKLDEIRTALQEFRKKSYKLKPTLSLLAIRNGQIDTISLEITRPKLRIKDNYNDNFIEVHLIIQKRLSKKNDKGLVLLHGKPGTGKTSYIRYLINSAKKPVIFLPPNMAGSIADPGFIALLINHPNSILVIEDAENIIIDRERHSNSPISALLNIADGLLSDCLNIQIICSFNTDIAKVDSALMRKGRLIAKYEFKELEVDKANGLSRKLGFDGRFDRPVTLTAIYNQGERDFQENKGRNMIGFKS